MSQKKNPRLQFTDAELNPRLKEHNRRAERAAEKAEAARKKIPKNRKKIKKRMIDQHTGKVKKHLQFEETDRPAPPSKLSHAIREVPGLALSAQVHKNIQELEQDNIGVESAHELTQTAEGSVRVIESAYHSHKLKPYRAAAKAERRLEQANVNLLYQKHVQDNPQLASNPLSRWRQKQVIRKQYAASVRSGQSAAAVAENSVRAAKKAAQRSKETAAFFRRHKRGFLVVIGLALVVALLLTCVSSCTMLFQAGLSAVGSSTYPASDTDILGAEAAYAGMEAELEYELNNYEALHSGYDEYVYELDAIGHDPYVLISILSALHPEGWTLESVRETLERIFAQQYTLTESVVAETRYDSDGDPYSYTVCTVTLKNFDLSRLPVYLLTEVQLGTYSIYMRTLGNRLDLFPRSEYPNASQREDYLDYDVPPEALEDEVFPAMLTAAEKSLG